MDFNQKEYSLTRHVWAFFKAVLILTGTQDL